MTLVGVSIDRDCERTRSMVQDRHIDWPQLCDGKGLDGSIPQAYRVEAPPAYFVIGGDGTMIWSTSDASELRPWLSRALQTVPEDPIGASR